MEYTTKDVFVTTCKRSLGQGYVLTPVILFTVGGGHALLGGMCGGGGMVEGHA